MPVQQQPQRTQPDPFQHVAPPQPVVAETPQAARAPGDQARAPSLPVDVSVFQHMAEDLSLGGQRVSTQGGPAAGAAANAGAAQTGGAPAGGAQADGAQVPTLADYGSRIDGQLDASILANRRTRTSLDQAREQNSDNAGTLEEQLNGDRRGLLNQLNQRSGVYDREIATLDQQLGGRIPRNPTPEQQELINRRTQLVQGRDRFDDQQTALQRWSDRNEINDINTRLQDPQLSQQDRTQLLQRKRTLATGLLSTVEHYQQFDPRWGSTIYGKDRSYSDMTEAGCGPTALAIAMDFQDQEDPEGHHSRGETDPYTPRDMADYATNHGRVKGSGTAGQVMMDDLNGSYANVQGNTLANRAEAKESLDNGVPVIFVGRNVNGSTENGTAARPYGGHFMVLSGVSEDGQTFQVTDGGRRSGRNITSMSRQQVGASTYGYWNVGEAEDEEETRPS